ncbi:hypothetical protein R5R35_010548 [Gryllus longicercus]|uniref:C-type lectin domain-containing protein n=1 Tax=Gryllus longicercus TaxID=2509291 RepID=A0AAN9V8Z7_9ORTH
MKQYEVPGAVWTGISDVTAEQVWVTSLGDPLSSTGYEVWAPGQPNELGRALCLGLVPGKGHDDLYCRATERPFLCELID